MARAQNTQHLTYASAVDGASAMVENYLLQGQDDTSSVVPVTEEQIARRIALQAAEQQVRDARAEFEAAEQALIDLGDDISALEKGEVDPYDSVSQSGRKAPKEKEPSLTDVAEPPDHWIDTYQAGKEMPIVRDKVAKSLVNVQLEAYTGRELDWFAWISMWFALVHITCKTPSEKLAILKNYMMGDLADIVHGHGRGEACYKEVLQRLKSTYGSRKVIRAAHLREMDQIEAPRNDHNLSNALLSVLSLKLQLTDRLAWNNGWGAEIDHRNINDFGRWLTARTMAYQNAYAIADEQQRLANVGNRNERPQSSQVPNRFQQQQQKRNVLAYHVATAGQREKGNGSAGSSWGMDEKERRPTDFHCLKCEGAYRLEDCRFFKDLTISEWMSFAQRRVLCYGCFGVRHGAITCTLKKACGVNGYAGQRLVEQVRRFCDTESFGTEFQVDGMSSETRRAVMKMISELEKLPIGYAAPVLWKDGIPPDIPDSRCTAETRLVSLKNRFSRNPEYERFYHAAIEKNFMEGYARRVPPEEVAERPTRYFLPHFGVPKVAILTTWRAADDAGLDTKEAGDEVRSDIYVDDYLASAGKMVDALTTVNYTRVGLLAQEAGLFDPLGITSTMTVKAKIKLRELGVKCKKWEDAVVGDENAWWEQYFKKIKRLKEVEFARCLFPKAEEIVRTELYTFADMSEEECAASCYNRVVYRYGQVLVRHVKTALKLAPLKTVSVCKLELNAGLIGARLAKIVQTALKRKMDGRFFWTDSSTVQNWVRAVSSHYQVYVSHRIEEIQTLTEPDEWRCIPVRLNPADAATRSQLEEDEIPSWWLDGPAFLYEEESGWPTDLPWMVAKKEL
ncbi:Uncharacterized protein APZ42_014015 [Daphnia magna]|uniref:Uncharacterized protein n=1 Tax=Daphnia magna TaxID=35525 RepID=A0A162QAR4_9CRUS|nr:Uncharacterized protein APZ42_014015 [Daphnia magna]